MEEEVEDQYREKKVREDPEALGEERKIGKFPSTNMLRKSKLHQRGLVEEEDQENVANQDSPEAAALIVEEVEVELEVLPVSNLRDLALGHWAAKKRREPRAKSLELFVLDRVLRKEDVDSQVKDVNQEVAVDSLQEETEEMNMMTIHGVRKRQTEAVGFSVLATKSAPMFMCM